MLHILRESENMPEETNSLILMICIHYCGYSPHLCLEYCS